MNTFINNLRLIEKHNSQNQDFKLGINQFAELTLEEFREYMGFNKRKYDQEPMFLLDDNTSFTIDDTQNDSNYSF